MQMSSAFLYRVRYFKAWQSNRNSDELRKRVVSIINLQFISMNVNAAAEIENLHSPPPVQCLNLHGNGDFPAILHCDSLAEFETVRVCRVQTASHAPPRAEPLGTAHLCTIHRLLFGEIH